MNHIYLFQIFFFCGDLDLLHTLHPHKPNPFLFFLTNNIISKSLTSQCTISMKQTTFPCQLEKLSRHHSTK